MARLGIKLAALGIVLGAIGVAAVVVVGAPKVHSESLAEPWDALQGQLWLKANLRDAEMVAPDRPHSLQEVELERSSGRSIERKRTFLVNTNAQRLRGSTDVGPKAAGVKRVLGIGESVSFGWGVADDETWQARLQALLTARGHQVEVLNAGMPSAGPSTMEAFCKAVAPDLEPDVVVLVRRTEGQRASAAQLISSCEGATRVPTVLAMPPLSTFDLRGQREAQRSRNQVAGLVRQGKVIDLGPAFAEARGERGEVLVQRGGELHVLDQETGEIWLSVPAPGPKANLPQEIGELFDREEEVREALIFDGGHPDAEGHLVFAQALVEPMEALLGP